MGKEGEMIALEVFKTRPWPAPYCTNGVPCGKAQGSLRKCVKYIQKHKIKRGF